MLIVHGAYHFWPKRVAYRNDYCLSCQAPRQSVAIRTFDVGHIYWIPILPVGFWKHWRCSGCGRDPHVSRKPQRSFKWVGLFLLTLLSVAFWVSPIDADFAAGCWIIRIAAPIGAALVLIHLLRGQGEPSLRERLAAIPPTADVMCPFCSIPLVTGTSARWSCPACGVLRY